MKVASIKLENGQRVRAVKFAMGGATYWLLPQDAKIAEAWDPMSPPPPELGEEDISRADFIQKNAVRVDGRPDDQPPEDFPFKMGDVVTLKSGGFPFTVEAVFWPCGHVGLIATEYRARFVREVLPWELLKLAEAGTKDLPF